MQGTVVGFVNTFTVGSLGRAAIFSLGIMPYITASIILQLLTVVWPYLEKLSKEGEMGRKKITQYTRYARSSSLSSSRQRSRASSREPSFPAVADSSGSRDWFRSLMAVLTLTTGCAVVMWLGEQISERGIGNGISLIIFAGHRRRIADRRRSTR